MSGPQPSTTSNAAAVPLLSGLRLSEGSDSPAKILSGYEDMFARSSQRMNRPTPLKPGAPSFTANKDFVSINPR
jgi:hypothetical protein